MDNNDYEKAKSECWEKVPLIISPKNAFEFGFHSAWHHPKAYTQPVNGLANERLQVAAMAMQGLLSSNVWMKAIMRETELSNGSTDDSNVIPLIATMAVTITNTLLTELNKETP